MRLPNIVCFEYLFRVFYSDILLIHIRGMRSSMQFNIDSELADYESMRRIQNDRREILGIIFDNSPSPAPPPSPSPLPSPSPSPSRLPSLSPLPSPSPSPLPSPSPSSSPSGFGARLFRT